MTIFDKKIVILGSGIAGLSALYYCMRKGIEVSCFTADTEETIGGLCASFKVGDFTFDNAVHLSFANEKEVREIFDKSPYYSHKPISYNFDREYWLRHPVQNNLYQLPSSEKIAIIESFIDAPKSNLINNYEDWLIAQYGSKFAASYPIKYTKKYWSLPANKLGVNWIGNRMNKVELKDILRGAFDSLDENHYYTAEMRYPKAGGYKAFISPLIEDTKEQIVFESAVAEIDATFKKVKFTNGIEIRYETLISSIPLPELIKLIKNPNKDMLQLANSLIATSVDLISIGFSRVVTDKLWFYIYDEDIYAARAYAPHVKSPANVPEGCSSLQFEIYSSIKSEKKYTVEEMIENTIYALQKMNIADADDILFIEHKCLKYGNVIFDLGMEERRDKLLTYVRSLGIEPIGRFGLWDYLWSNQAFMSGMRAVLQMNDNDA